MCPLPVKEEPIKTIKYRFRVCEINVFAIRKNELLQLIFYAYEHLIFRLDQKLSWVYLTSLRFLPAQPKQEQTLFKDLRR